MEKGLEDCSGAVGIGEIADRRLLESPGVDTLIRKLDSG